LQYFPYFCGMIEISRHIEILLLTNDCVIVPRLGGFVAHHVPASYQPDENLFLPPSRVIGFNPQLKMNDGLLVQSYMSVYGNSFSAASKMIDSKVDEILSELHSSGFLRLPNIGELRYDIHNHYHFQPYDNKLSTPYLYGLDSFVIRPLAQLRPAAPTATPVPSASPAPQAPSVASIPQASPVVRHTHRHNWALRLRQASLSVTMIVLVLLSFLFSAPLSNTEVSIGHHHACLTPDNLIKEWQSRSLAFTAINAPQQAVTSPVAVREVKVPRAEATTDIKATPKPIPTATPRKRYHIIVASVASEAEAHRQAEKLRAEGHSEAQAIIGNGKMRVSIASCATQTEAGEKAKQMRESNTHPGAWVLKK